jgi:hypothetical protein
MISLKGERVLRLVAEVKGSKHEDPDPLLACRWREPRVKGCRYPSEPRVTAR